MKIIWYLPYKFKRDNLKEYLGSRHLNFSISVLCSAWHKCIGKYWHIHYGRNCRILSKKICCLFTFLSSWCRIWFLQISFFWRAELKKLEHRWWKFQFWHFCSSWTRGCFISSCPKTANLKHTIAYIMNLVDKKPRIFRTKSYKKSYCGPRLGIFVVRNTLC